MLPSLADSDHLLLKFLSSDEFVTLDTSDSSTTLVASSAGSLAPVVHAGFRHDVHGRGVADHPTLGWLYVFEAHADVLQQIGILRRQIDAGTAPADVDEQMAWIPGFALCDSDRDGTIDSYHLVDDLWSQHGLSAHLVE